MEYNLLNLNPREFESLVADIISKHLSINVEKFKAGKDGGVDGRFWIGNDKEGIIQCKHYLKTGYKILLNKLKKEEVAKVKKLNPARYIFVTSVGLSRPEKKEIKEIFTPYIKREDDVWGQDDINDFLLKNPKIVEENYKLWITSTKVLDILLNNAIKGRSESTLTDINEHSAKYVITANHVDGLRLLKENNVVIITGEPGLGKTMLADNLALYYVAKGYEFCDIEETLSEAENLFRQKEGKKMIFYFDDFLGSNVYDAVTNKKDSHIMKFINRVRKDDTKKLILTSRTGILNISEWFSPIFKNKNIRENELLLTVKNLKELDKARILYNHVYFTSLSDDYIDQIYEDKRYREIINHRNYNPRIIEFITDIKRVEKIPDEYWVYIENSLDNPKDIWADYFQVQADDYVRGLVFLVVFNNGNISEEVYRNAYERYIHIRAIKSPDHTDKSFNSAIKIATRSLLNRLQKEKTNIHYSLFNPSIADFVHHNYLDEEKLIIDILSSLKTVASIDYLKLLEFNKMINKKMMRRIQDSLFEYLFDDKIEEKDWDYLLALCYIDLFNSKIQSKVVQILKSIIGDHPEGVRGIKLIELLSLIDIYRHEISIKEFDFIYQFIGDRVLDEDEVEELLDFVQNFEIEDTQILTDIADETVCFVRDQLESFEDDVDISQYIESSYGYEGEPDHEINVSGIDCEIDNYIEGIMKNFNNEALDKVGFSWEEAKRDLDIDDLASNNIENYYQGSEDDGFTHFNNTPEIDNIDLLFERS